MLGGWEQHADLLPKLGQHSLRQEILNIKRLDDVDVPALKRLLGAAYKRARQIAQEEGKKRA
jgi:hypothetical protein